MNWVKDIIIPLISAFMGGLLTFFGTLISFHHEKTVRNQEEIKKIRPVLINQMVHSINDKNTVPRYLFLLDKQVRLKHTITGVFKNTDSGILFFDYIEIKGQKYYPRDSNAVDKNTFFYIMIEIDNKDASSCRIFFMDAMKNQYHYDAKLCYDSNQSQITILDSLPNRTAKRKVRK